MNRLTLIVMAIGISSASMAFANDGSKLIYDLTELGQHDLASSSSEMFYSQSAPATSPRAGRTNQSDLSIDWSAGNLEVSHTRGRNRSRSGGVLQQTREPEDQDGPNKATPTPEPGTLLLMGSGLVAGARSLRRRRNKSV